MVRSVEAVRTVPGVLTYHLDQLDFRREELARRAKVSVRTIHNIEHGRKRVSTTVLETVANILSQCWREQYPAAEAPFLSADCFSTDPMAIGKTFLTALALGRPELLVNDDHSVLARDAVWNTPGDPGILSFAGTYGPTEMQHVFEQVGKVFLSLDFTSPKILTDSSRQIFMVRTIVKATHPHSRQSYDFLAYMEMDMREAEITRVQGIYDDARLSEFCLSGGTPQLRKSQR